MSKLILTLAIVLIGMIGQAQIDDVMIASSLMGRHISEIDAIADSLGIIMTLHENEKLFVSANGVTKYYKIKSGTFIKKMNHNTINTLSDRIVYIFIRYNHKEHLHLHDFKSAIIPKTSSYNFEKSLGRNYSHIKVWHPESYWM
jgi:hypothetical protein